MFAADLSYINFNPPKISMLQVYDIYHFSHHMTTCMTIQHFHMTAQRSHAMTGTITQSMALYTVV
jgi:hypothetical protein